ncbi:L-arabinose isomerase family protein [Paenilisteria rocourtiae]|uniref:L-arabinose isomerase-like protein n=1 Tax=Listeria rocourtiae TaxID=647910 RepID=A0A4R6ZRB0_9LIST|nr:hypothetical protein [Listeria rocourtiae]EUJ49311.1 L-arabinose isomerase [Listeria rocourtiae FSL F6-920]MBC1435923.1 hypothetical protein [Listeria rocourtiae]MBC1603525.1 hypothetical protein [Listeria rocourtiae]TDR55190.1 L-arabinose isomerase-like protein [Listeria rocourtiae]
MHIQFGWVVDYFGIGDLFSVIDAVTDEELNALFDKFMRLYNFEHGSYNQKVREAHMKVLL